MIFVAFSVLRSRKVRCLLSLQNPAGIISGIATCFLGFGSSLFSVLRIQPMSRRAESLGGCGGSGDFGHCTPKRAARVDVGKWEVDRGQQF